MSYAIAGRNSLSFRDPSTSNSFGMCRLPLSKSYHDFWSSPRSLYSGLPSPSPSSSPSDFGTDTSFTNHQRFDNVASKMLSSYRNSSSSFHPAPPTACAYTGSDQVSSLRFSSVQHGIPFASYQAHRSSAHSIPDTLEPSMLLRQQDLPGNTDTFLPYDTATSHVEQPCPTPDFEFDAAFYQPATLEDQSLYTDRESSPTNMEEETADSPPSRQVEEEEETTGKPYARLIYEALMEAPGHRMMLRDIYEWFTQHTKKPQASGSNGWQNSIRHNLSMNQAFENDKSFCSPASSQSRKANSVWVLTDFAVKHGIQSTTRYRKPGTNKKSTVDRSSNIQRQVSGSRGGRAAKRSATRLRYQKERPDTTGTDTTANFLPPFQPSDAQFNEIGPACTPQYEQQPTTPCTLDQLEPLYALPSALHTCDQDYASNFDTYRANDFDYDFFVRPDSSPRYNGEFEIKSE